MAHTWRPASHRIFMAVLPPAPVPTTIASYTFAANEPNLSSSLQFEQKPLNSPAHEGWRVRDRQDADRPASSAIPNEARDSPDFPIQFSSCNSRQPCNPASAGKMRVHSLSSV